MKWLFDYAKFNFNIDIKVFYKGGCIRKITPYFAKLNFCEVENPNDFMPFVRHEIL